VNCCVARYFESADHQHSHAAAAPAAADDDDDDDDDEWTFVALILDSLLHRDCESWVVFSHV